MLENPDRKKVCVCVERERDLSNTTKQLDLTDTNNTHYATMEYTFFSRVYGKFTKIDYISWATLINLKE